MSELLERGRRILSQQSFSNWLGMELLRLSPDFAECALTLRDDMRQQHGIAHGGVVSALADATLAFAAGSIFEDVVTLEFKINFVRPARGARLTARASVLHAGKRQAVVRCDVTCDSDDGEQLCALAQGTISRKEVKP
ncbi:MAG TPA: PaaI family thioesterase [Polyangiales bacterium]